MSRQAKSVQFPNGWGFKSFTAACVATLIALASTILPASASTASFFGDAGFEGFIDIIPFDGDPPPVFEVDGFEDGAFSPGSTEGTGEVDGFGFASGIGLPGGHSGFATVSGSAVSPSGSADGFSFATLDLILTNTGLTAFEVVIGYSLFGFAETVLSLDPGATGGSDVFAEGGIDLSCSIIGCTPTSPAGLSFSDSFFTSSTDGGPETGLPFVDGVASYILAPSADLSILIDVVVDGAAFVEDPASVVPLPAALPLFAGGLGLLGVVGWRRRRQAAA